jgi:hypothetical protein
MANVVFEIIDAIPFECQEFKEGTESEGADVRLFVHFGDLIKDILSVGERIEDNGEVITDMLNEDTMCLLISNLPGVRGPCCRNAQWGVDGDRRRVQCRLWFRA